MVRPFALVLSIESHSSNKILRNNTQQSTYIIINVGPGGGVEHIMDGVEEYYTLSTQQSTICWKWLDHRILTMKKKRKNWVAICGQG